MVTRDRSATEPELVLVISRVFDAPPSLVFKAWTSPEHLLRWWGPKDFTVPSCEVDFRLGGAWRACIRSADGVEYWHGGTYREIAEPRRLVFTHAWDDAQGKRGRETLITVTFTEEHGKTKLTFRQAVFETVVDRDNHLGGWSECLDRLTAYVANA